MKQTLHTTFRTSIKTIQTNEQNQPSIVQVILSKGIELNPAMIEFAIKYQGKQPRFFIRSTTLDSRSTVEGYTTSQVVKYAENECIQFLNKTTN